MGELQWKHITTTFMRIAPGATPSQVVELLRWKPEAERLAWYFLVPLANNSFAVIRVDDFVELDDERTVDLDAPLTATPGLLMASKQVERTAQGKGQADHIRRRSHKRRLVVLEAGEPVGILVDELMAGGSDIAPLFEPERFNAFPRLDAPNVVEPGEMFDVIVGYRDRPDATLEDVSPMLIPDASPDAALLVNFIADGADVLGDNHVSLPLRLQSAAVFTCRAKPAAEEIRL